MNQLKENFMAVNKIYSTNPFGGIMYKKILILFLSFFVVSNISFAQENPDKELNLLEKITEKGDWTFRDFEVVLEFEQPVDHNNPDGQTFTQRVFLKHTDFDAPMVLHTRGYFARPGSDTEIARILNCNEVEVEHRYFRPSIPDSIDWQYLTIEQAAADFHVVTEYLKQFYGGKWISTGASKGGQTALYQEYFYPEDIDVTIAYVAPINLAMEDTRVPAYLSDSISTPEARTRMLNCQRAILERRDEIMPLVLKDMEENETEFIIDDKDLCYEYGVFETSFAWWQYGPGDENEIPLPDATTEELFTFLQNGINFFYKTQNDLFKPFNYQAYTEVGFYSYDTRPFKDLLKAVKDDFATNKIFFADQDWDVTYNPEPLQKVNEFLMTEGNNIIYIYGEFDPWTATGVWPSPNTNSFRMTLPGGNHGTGILTFEGDDREKILTSLEDWLDLKINRRRLARLRR